jgi:hypothetical protein
MSKWTWTLVLGGVVVLLFLWSLRENFDNYAEALNKVGQSTGYTDKDHPDAPHTGVGTAGTLSDTPKPKDAPKEPVKDAPAARSENTTGGSSLNPAPNSGKDVDGNNVYGPAYTGMGDPYDGGLGNEGERQYPVLIGPKPKKSTMVESGAIRDGSNKTDTSALPGSGNVGSDEENKYFGTSRLPAKTGTSSKSPGDKDLFPNPYQEFTPSIGSSKTEPVPFLSDFSAFQK